jgi:UDP-glucose 4-epimerase
MNILITGAAGFLGRHFAKHHIYRDHSVVAVDNLSNPHSSWPFQDAVPLTRIDAATFLTTPVAEHYWDVVYWFAAPVGGREKIEGDPLFNADSLRLDAALFRWASQRGLAKIIVYPSSSAVYGWMHQRDDAVALKEVYFTPGAIEWAAPDEMYGFTKMAAEILADRAARYRVDTLCIRPFSGYGEDQSLEYPVPSIIARVKAREDPLIVWGPGTQTRDFVHVDDIVKITEARIRSGVNGYQTLNIGRGSEVSFNELAATAAELAGYAPWIKNLPDKPFGVMRRYADVERMLQYGTPDISLREGLSRMLK